MVDDSEFLRGLQASDLMDRTRRQAQQFEDMRKQMIGPAASWVEQARRQAQQIEDMRKQMVGPTAGWVEQARRQAQQIEDMRKQMVGPAAGWVEQARRQAQQIEDMRKQMVGPAASWVEQARRQAQQIEDMRKQMVGPAASWVEQARRQAQQIDDIRKQMLGPTADWLEQVRRQAQQFGDMRKQMLGLQTDGLLDQARQFASAIAVAGVAGGFDPRSVVESLAAESVVRTGLGDDLSEQVRGTSPTFDALLATTEIIEAERAARDDQSLFQVISEIVRVFRGSLASVQSVAEFQGLVQLTLLFLAASQVWYAMKSVNPEDIDKLRSSVEQQTIVVKENRDIDAQRLQVERERLELERSKQARDEPQSGRESERIREVLSEFFSVLDAAADRLASKVRPVAYIARRDFTLKKEARLRSETLALITRGTVVHLLSDEKKWIRIQHFDYFSGRLIEGWVPKKHFRRLSQ